jgi:hypothetical protein
MRAGTGISIHSSRGRSWLALLRVAAAAHTQSARHTLTRGEARFAEAGGAEQVVNDRLLRSIDPTGEPQTEEGERQATDPSRQCARGAAPAQGFDIVGRRWGRVSCGTSPPPTASIRYFSGHPTSAEFSHRTGRVFFRASPKCLCDRFAV